MLQKPMLLNFFATWCQPCIKELPTLSQFSRRHKDKVLLVGAALNSDFTDVEAAKKRFLINYEILMVNDALASLWQAQALPTTYLIDTKGKILWAHSGIATEEDLEKAIKLIPKKS
jgi:thiol-disulfide isomerase/thioredoxin